MRFQHLLVSSIDWERREILYFVVHCWWSKIMFLNSRTYFLINPSNLLSCSSVFVMKNSNFYCWYEFLLLLIWIFEKSVRYPNGAPITPMPLQLTFLAEEDKLRRRDKSFGAVIRYRVATFSLCHRAHKLGRRITNVQVTTTSNVIAARIFSLLSNDNYVLL